MTNNSVRIVILFALIALVLGGFVVGGVQFMKARNDSYAAASQSRQTPQANQPAQTNQNQPSSNENQNKDNQEQQTPQPAPSNQNTNPSPSAAQTPAPSTPAASSTPAQQPSSIAATGATPQGGMPATGPADFFATAGLLALATFFGARLLRARADYRRYVGS